MLIFHRFGLVLLSVPKTGTHSYIDHLHHRADIVIKHPPALKHMGMARFNTVMRPLLETPRHRLETVAVIREPLDWLWSWYRYRARPEIVGQPTSTAAISFDDFVAAYLAETPPPFARIGRQSHMIWDAGRRQRADHLFRYDRLDLLNAFLGARLGMAVGPTARLNPSPEGRMRVAPATLDLLADRYQFEYELYDAAEGREAEPERMT